ncbi:TPA: CPBP family intramembrane metalloprotease [Streptococcus pyogenes]|nr:CPBP family intramembrane metalloprotease [Streptococcus pyogenes]HES9435541.1 CPBP family intramembrane metalloprotease [Streptococcus pyogenes]HES9442663.1 CPBP family intramembrane metalloprotease [Streptococcus pyogenes]
MLEEILFRGILQEKLSRVSFWLSIIVTSVIFSYIHGNDTILNTQFISSLIYGMAYQTSKDLRFPIINHSLQNLIVLLTVVLLKYVVRINKNNWDNYSNEKILTMTK